MYKKEHTTYVRFGTVPGFRHPLGGSECTPPEDKGRLLKFLANSCDSPVTLFFVVN